MNSIMYAALAEEHRQNLLDQARMARRAALADATGSTSRGHARRGVGHPFVAFHSWLARGYL
ncbi:MAG: hypothetical protein ABI429_03795 [Jatrophihabitantaceae bacterium]